MKRYPLLAFLTVTFLISWGAWFGTAPLASGGKALLPISAKYGQMLAGFAPGIAAVIITGFTGGMAALQRLFEGLLIWRVRCVWYLVALLLPSAISLFMTGLHTMMGGDAPDFSTPPVAQMHLPALLSGWSPVAITIPLFLYHLLCGTGLAEEIGWRGIVLTRLQQRWSPGKASAIIGVLWAVWVLPLYWLQGWVGANQRGLYLLSFIPAAFLSTWIFNGTGGSLLLVLLFNVSLKVTDLLVAAPVTYPIIPVISYWLVAAIVWISTKRRAPARKMRERFQRPATEGAVLETAPNA